MTSKCPKCGCKIEPEASMSFIDDPDDSMGDGGSLSNSNVPAQEETVICDDTVVLDDSCMDGAMTIQEFMVNRDMKGGVDLDDTAALSSASDVLTSRNALKYQIGKIVASGGMGSILEAKDMNLRRNVAMKVIIRPGTASKKQILRFIEEAQVTGQLEHPGIVPVYELGIDRKGHVFYAMKYIKGATLKDILYRIKKGDKAAIKQYSLRRLLSIFQKICDAMAYAHSKNVIHRDLKPENVMVGDYGEVVIMDWGLAKWLDKKELELEEDYEEQDSDAPIDSVRQGDDEECMRTVVGTVMGTPQFMAPEQARGQSELIDKRTDIYMLGGILYNILTLNPPITERKQKKALEKAVSRKVPHPSSYNRGARVEDENVKKGSGLSDSVMRVDMVRLRHCPNERVPSALAEVAMKALRSDLKDRYQTVRKLQKDIEAYQAGFATSVERGGLLKRLGLLVCRHKSVTALSVIASIVLAVVLGASYLLHAKEKRNSIPALVTKVGVLVEQEEFSEALKTLSYITTVVPEEAEYHAMKGDVLQTLLKLEEAVVSYEKALDLDPSLNPAGENLILCRKIIEENRGNKTLLVSSVYEIYLAMRKQWRFEEAMVLARRLSGKEEELREKLKDAKVDMRWLKRDADGVLSLRYRSKNVAKLTGIPLSGLDISSSRITDISALKGMPLSRLNIGNNFIVDISVLRNMPLNELFMQSTKVVDLAPLRGMILRELYAGGTPVSDLSPLMGMPLRILDVHGTEARDLYPLEGMRLRELYLRETLVDDISPLKGMPLVKLDLQETRVFDVTPLRNMGLQELNISMTQVSDISPLEGMPLTELDLTRLKSLDDISILKGMKLNNVKISGTSVVDLSPLAGMKVTTVDISETSVDDITPLRDVQMTKLFLFDTSVTDLSPLRGKTLKMLDISLTRISDLSVLKGMNITALRLEKTPVDDLSPLVGMKLASLDISSTFVDDLSPLQGMPLVSLKLKYTKVDDLLPLKEMRTLTRLEGVETRRSLIRDVCEGRLSIIKKNAQNFIMHFKNVPAMAGAVLYAEEIMKNINLLRSLPRPFRGVVKKSIAFKGHHYLAFPLVMSWKDAEAFCAPRGGHLVTITSKDEHDFVLELARKAGWGSVLVGYKLVDRKLQWVTDETWKLEDYQNSHFMDRQYGFIDTRSGRWSTCGNILKYFVIEWDE